MLTLLLDWCVDPVTQTHVGRLFGTKSVQQSSPTENTTRRVYTHASLDDQGMGEVDCPKFWRMVPFQIIAGGAKTFRTMWEWTYNKTKTILEKKCKVEAHFAMLNILFKLL